MRTVGSFLMAFFLCGSANAQLSTSDLTTLTPTDLATVIAPCEGAVSNVTYQGANIAAGSFTGGTGIIGFESGIVLSTGDISHVIGPNTSDSITAINATPGDGDLSALVGGVVTHDAAILEFDFVPFSNSISLDFVFSSDEHNEFTGQFPDVVGVFVNGINVALVPGVGDPIAVTTIGLINNPSFYINNDIASGAPLNTEMDGLTVVLTATSPVTAGSVNHIKIAIADALDKAYDSNVFIKERSLTFLQFISLTAALGCEGVTLNWNLLLCPVTKFQIFRSLTPGGAQVLIGEVSGTTTVFVDTGVVLSDFFCYVVKAISGSAVFTTSNEVCVDVSFPPFNLTAISGCEGVELNWDPPVCPPSSGIFGVTKFQIFRSLTPKGAQVLIGEVPGTTTVLVDTGVVLSDFFCYVVKAISGSAVLTTSNEVCVDVSFPPFNLAALSLGCEGVELNWDPPVCPPSSGIFGVTKFQIFRSLTPGGAQVLIGEVPGATAVFVDTGVVPDSFFCYVVKALDVSNAVVTVSNESCVQTITIPLDLSAVVGCDGFELDWSGACPLGTLFAVTEYQVFRSDVPNGATTFVAAVPGTQTTLVDPNLLPSQQACYFVTGHKADGEEITRSNTACAVAPAGFVVTLATSLTCTGDVNLNWSAIPDCPFGPGILNISSYTVFRSAVPGGPQVVIASDLTTTVFTDTTVVAGDLPCYQVKLFSNVGEFLSNEACVSGIPQQLILSTTLLCDGVTLNWTAFNDCPLGSALGVSSYLVFRSLVPGGLQTALADGLTVTSFTDTSVALGDSFCYQVRVTTGAGLRTRSNEVCEVVAITLTAQARTAAGGIEVTWDVGVAIDCPVDSLLGISSYSVFRTTFAGVPGPADLLAEVSAPTTSLTDPDVTFGVEFFYTVQAFNKDGVLVAEDAVSITLTEVPPPRNLTAYVECAGARVTVSWSAPTTGLTIAGFNVFRSTFAGDPAPAQVNPALVTGRFFVDTPSDVGPFFYAITSVTDIGEETLFASAAVLSSA